jgi:hypothetical protein
VLCRVPDRQRKKKKSLACFVGLLAVQSVSLGLIATQQWLQDQIPVMFCICNSRAQLLLMVSIFLHFIHLCLQHLLVFTRRLLLPRWPLTLTTRPRTRTAETLPQVVLLILISVIYFSSRSTGLCPCHRPRQGISRGLYSCLLKPYLLTNHRHRRR